MNREKIIENARRFTEDSAINYVSNKAALRPDYVGMKIFDSPIFAFGSADDDIYARYKSPDIIGNHSISPLEWMPRAKTVISFFLPYTERIKSANARDFDWPAEEWLHGRIEGQLFVKELLVFLHDLLSGAGYSCLIPSLDARFKTGGEKNGFTSNWSERHIAFACGLGTFGLSAGLITEKGVCGRFGSILTEMELPFDTRRYEDAYEYCILCGNCISNCPVRAISIEERKNHSLCSSFLDQVIEKHKPWYGCGKCQVGVPCESENPAAGKKAASR